MTRIHRPVPQCLTTGFGLLRAPDVIGLARSRRCLAALRVALACALALGASAARPDERERDQAERQRHRQELREHLRGERLRAPHQDEPGDAARRGAREPSYLSPDERQALRRQLREQPPWRGQR